MENEFTGKYRNLLYRRQYIYTVSKCDFPENWKHFEIDNYNLYAHPDLDISIIQKSDTIFILIGYIIDPQYPKFENKTVLEQLVSAGDLSIGGVSSFLFNKSGRFVLIIKTVDDTLVFHDACGLRTVYYANLDGSLALASQPNLFRYIAPLHIESNFTQYYGSNYVKNNLEHLIPSGISLYQNIFHLVPNHFLRFSNQKQTRFYPLTPMPKTNIQKGAEEASTMLGNILIAANMRFKLALPLTAGWDSRLLLAASKSIIDSLFLFTYAYRKMDDSFRDIEVPRKLVTKLGYQHHTLDLRVPMEDQFLDVYRRHSPIEHLNDWASLIFGTLQRFPQDRVKMIGNANIYRPVFYYYGVHDEVVNHDKIYDIVPDIRAWKNINFADQAVKKWYDESGGVFSSNKFDIIDMFVWEHKTGSWQAQSQLENDIVHETFSPFANREYLEKMLSVDIKYRTDPRYILFQKMMEILWPKMPKSEMNPPMNWKARLIKILSFLGLGHQSLQLIKKFKKKI